MLSQNQKSISSTDILFKEKVDLQPPKLFRVVLLNDDYTPMDFVVWILMKVFYKNETESTSIMLDTHNLGRGIVGIYPHDIARTKVFQTLTLAEQHEHPLQCIMERVKDDESKIKI